MIDAFLTYLGVGNNYTLFAILISGCICTFILMEFLFLVSYLFRKLGGF